MCVCVRALFAVITTNPVGEPPDERAQEAMRRTGISTDKTARMLTEEDFSKFSYILAMDHDILQHLLKKQPKESKSKTRLLGEYDERKELIIEDPFYVGFAGCIGVASWMNIFRAAKRNSSIVWSRLFAAAKVGIGAGC